MLLLLGSASSSCALWSRVFLGSAVTQNARVLGRLGLAGRALFFCCVLCPPCVDHYHSIFLSRVLNRLAIHGSHCPNCRGAPRLLLLLTGPCRGVRIAPLRLDKTCRGRGSRFFFHLDSSLTFRLLFTLHVRIAVRIAILHSNNLTKFRPITVRF